MSRWSQGAGEPESLIKLLAELDDEDGVDIDAAGVAAKQALTAGYSYIQGLEWLHRLRSQFPDPFNPEEWDRHLSGFET